MFKKIAFSAFLLASLRSLAQSEDEKLQIDSIYDHALHSKTSYEDLRFLCKEIGARLSGSEELEQAINWADTLMKGIGDVKVYRQDVTVPHWERKGQNAYYYSNRGRQKVRISALGGSVGTGNYKISSGVVEYESIEALEKADSADISGKMVFINKPFNESFINTFHAYGACSSQRYWGAVKAAEKGAIAVLIRSLSNSDDNHPHTGVMGYDENVDSIPVVALSIQSANLLSEDLKNDTTVNFSLKVNTIFNKDALSHNVIAEIKGSEFPDDIMTVGAHIDSWDIGEGAHDDGAGVVQVIDVLRIFNKMGYQPKHTIRFVLFTNEENGAKGAKRYAELAISNAENHVVAIESDRGGFSPRGFNIDSKDEELKMKIRSWKPFLEKFGLHDFSDGYGGVDIAPLKKVNENITLLGLNPDSQRYFTHHHAKSDVFESVNRRELALGTASIATLLYLLDQNVK
ncbi:MAG: M20/M25/M40 family metallo-hydrolase [Flavobacteriales bacterium]